MLKHLDPRARGHLDALTLSIAAIWVTTYIPVEWRPAAQWDTEFTFADVLANLVLYVPLGVCLCRRGWGTVLLLSGVCSATAEMLQMWSFARFPSSLDVLANVAGAQLGWSLWRVVLRRNQPPAIRVTPLLALGSLGAGVVVIVLWHGSEDLAPLENWDPTYSLLLGNEVTKDRPWSGRIERLEIYAAALTPKMLARSPQREDATRLLYRLPQPMVVRGDAVRIAQSVAARIAREISTARKFTVVAWVTPANLEQDGPARIVSFSRDTLHRNFDLGQEDKQIVFRIRSPDELADEDFRLQTASSLSTGPVMIVASYDGAVARIALDGAPAVRENIAVGTCLAPGLCDSNLAAGWSVLGASLALCALVLVGTDRPIALTLIGLVSAGAAILGDSLGGLAPPVVAVQPWAQVGAACGSFAIVLARLVASLSGRPCSRSPQHLTAA